MTARWLRNEELGDLDRYMTAARRSGPIRKGEMSIKDVRNSFKVCVI